jgi:hypothetical protein
MSGSTIHHINTTCFQTCLVAIVAAVLVGLLGIWGVIPTADGLLWRLLGTCGAIFGGAVLASAAIVCFQTNE